MMKRIIVRKSTDLRKIKTPEARADAILNSPMVEDRQHRNRPASRMSVSFTEGIGSDEESIRKSLRLSSQVPRKTSASLDDLFLETSRVANALILGGLNDSRKRRTRSQNFPPLQLADNDIKPRTRKSTIHEEEDKIEEQQSEAVSSYHQSTAAAQEASREEEGESSSGPQENEVFAVERCRVVMACEWNRLKEVIAEWEGVLRQEEDMMPDAASGDIRSAVGRTQLLLRKKFPFYEDLVNQAAAAAAAVEDAEPSSISMAGVPNSNDLRGYWATIVQAVEPLNTTFSHLKAWRQEGWAEGRRPKTPARPQQPRTPRAGGSVKKPGKRSVKRLGQTRAKPVAANRAAATTRPNFAQFRAQLAAKRAATTTTTATDAAEAEKEEEIDSVTAAPSPQRFARRSGFLEKLEPCDIEISTPVKRGRLVQGVETADIPDLDLTEEGSKHTESAENLPAPGSTEPESVVSSSHQQFHTPEQATSTRKQGDTGRFLRAQRPDTPRPGTQDRKSRGSRKSFLLLTTTGGKGRRTLQQRKSVRFVEQVGSGEESKEKRLPLTPYNRDSCVPLPRRSSSRRVSGGTPIGRRKTIDVSTPTSASGSVRRKLRP